MTLLLPNLFHFIIKISLTGILFAAHVLKYFEQDFPIELLGWLRYIFIPLIAALLHGFIGFIYELLLVPLYFWNVLWHPNGRSIYSMLCNPEGNGCFISRIDNPSHRRYCERARPVPHWVWRRKPSRLRFRQSANDEEDINMLFMTNETINFKDGKGVIREVTYLGSILSDGILKHKIRTQNDS
jgi:hypothetical protein